MMPNETALARTKIQELVSRMANDADAVSRILEQHPELADEFASAYPFDFSWDEMSLKLVVLRDGKDGDHDLEGVAYLLDVELNEEREPVRTLLDITSAPALIEMLKAQGRPTEQVWLTPNEMTHIKVARLARIVDRRLEHTMGGLKDAMEPKEVNRG